MKPIRVINQDFELLTEIDRYESLQVTRSWHGIGELELHINRHVEDVSLLQRGVLLFLGSDVRKVFVIRGREIELDDNGKGSENWVFTAPSLESVIGQRITLPPSHTAYDNKQGPAETVMKHYVEQNALNPEKTKRVLPYLDIATDQERGSTLSWNSRFKNLAEEQAEMSDVSGLGWHVYLDLQNQTWVFDVLEGRDLTTSQSTLPPVIFSPEFDSLRSLEYSEDSTEYKNFAYVAGPGEGTKRVVSEVGAGEGLERFEVFIDARDISDETDNEEPRPEQEIRDDLIERGQQKLETMKQEQYLEGQILTNSPFEYEKDYDLGDIVTVQNRAWNVTMDARITEIKEIYEPGKIEIEAVFGNDQPTLIDKLKRVLGQYDNEMKR